MFEMREVYEGLSQFLVPQYEKTETPPLVHVHRIEVGSPPGMGPQVEESLHGILALTASLLQGC